MGFAEGESIDSMGVENDPDTTFDFDDSDIEDEQFDAEWTLSVGNGSHMDVEAQGAPSDLEIQHPTKEQRNDGERAGGEVDSQSISQQLASDLAGTIPSLTGDEKEPPLWDPLPQVTESDEQEQVLELKNLDDGLLLQNKKASALKKLTWPRTKVFVHDAAYSTYRALLLYVSIISNSLIISLICIGRATLPAPFHLLQIYTDKIHFAPLASSFTTSDASEVSSVRHLKCQTSFLH